MSFHHVCGSGLVKAVSVGTGTAAAAGGGGEVVQVGLVGTVYTHRRKYSMIKSFSNH